MTKLSKYILFFSILIVFSISSCEKFSGGGDSISGAWLCRVENELTPQYSVIIGSAGFSYDTTMFIINNFHNLGYEHETYVQLKDTIVTIISMDGYSVSGKGSVTRDFRSIEWNYSISGPGANDGYVISLYLKK